MYANCHRVCERYSRRTSVLINRLLYNDSSREQHNNEIYAGEIYGGNNSEREERVGEEKKKKWLTCFSTRLEELRCLRSVFSRFVPCSRDFPARDKRLIRSSTLFPPRPREKYIFPRPRHRSRIYLFNLSSGQFYPGDKGKEKRYDPSTKDFVCLIQGRNDVGANNTTLGPCQTRSSRM